MVKEGIDKAWAAWVGASPDRHGEADVTGKPLDGVNDAFGRKRDSTGNGAWLVYVFYLIFSPSESRTTSLLLHLMRGFC